MRRIPLLRSLSNAALALWLLLPLAAAAQDKLQVAQSLVRASGLWQQLESIGPQVQAGLASGLAAQGQAEAKAQAGALAQQAATAFAADRLRRSATQVIANGLDEAQVPALQAWYGSPLGMQVARLEERAAAEQQDAQALMTQGQAVLDAAPAARRELLVQLVQATQAGEAAVELVVGMTVAVQRGLLATAPNAPALGSADLRRALQSQRAEWLQAYTALSLASFALAYQSLSDTDLQRYLAFLRSPEGRSFSALGIQALVECLGEATEDLGRALGAAMGRARS